MTRRPRSDRYCTAQQRSSPSSSRPIRSTSASGHTRAASPGHVHYVVQPVTAELMHEYEAYGPRLQVAMFEAAEALPEDEVVAFADRARAAF